MKKRKNLSPEKAAIAILRDLVASFPEFGTDEPINGADAVDTIGVFVGRAQDLLRLVDRKRRPAMKRRLPRQCSVGARKDEVCEMRDCGRHAVCAVHGVSMPKVFEIPAHAWNNARGFRFRGVH